MSKATELGCDPNLGVFQLMEQRHHAIFKKGQTLMATRNPFYTSTLGIHLYLRGTGAPRFPLSQGSSALEASCYSPQKISRNPIKPFLCSPLPFCLLCNLRCPAPPEPLSVVLSSYVPSANTTNILFDRVLHTLYTSLV